MIKDYLDSFMIKSTLSYVVMKQLLYFTMLSVPKSQNWPSNQPGRGGILNNGVEDKLKAIKEF